MMEFQMVNTILAWWDKKINKDNPNIRIYDHSYNGITERIEIERDKYTSRCYLLDHKIIVHFNVKRESHIAIIKEGLESLEITIQQLIQNGLEER